MAAVMPHESDSTADEHIETESDGASDFSEDEDASIRDEFIGRLHEMGFDEKKAVRALEAAQGDLGRAVEILSKKAESKKDQNLQMMLDMGYAEDAAHSALQRCGSVDEAIDLIASEDAQELPRACDRSRSRSPRREAPKPKAVPKRPRKELETLADKVKKAVVEGLAGPEGKKTSQVQDSIRRGRISAWRHHWQDDPSEKDFEAASPMGYAKMKGYQRVGVRWLLSLAKLGYGGILADEMGLGKTAQALVFLDLLMKVSKASSGGALFLAVVPVAVLENWERECAAWCPHFRVFRYHSSQAKERWELAERFLHDRMLQKGPTLVLTTSSVLGNKEDRAVFFRNVRFECILCDEAHGMRNAETIAFKHVDRIPVKRRVLMTGTPVHNNLQELGNLLKLVLQVNGQSASSRMVRVARELDGIVERQSLRTLQVRAAPFMMRRLKKDVMNDLPEKICKAQRCPLTPEQRKQYDAELQKAKASTKMKKTQARKYLKNLFSRLRRLCNHPLLCQTRFVEDDYSVIADALRLVRSDFASATREKCVAFIREMDDYELVSQVRAYKLQGKLADMGLNPGKLQISRQDLMNSAKVQELIKILEGQRAENQKTLVFSQFTMYLDVIQHALSINDLPFARLDGTCSLEDRQSNIDLFQKPGSGVDIFLLSMKAGGTGLNLTAANRVILMDLSWNPQDNRQAEDRAHRLGQQQSVSVTYLTTADTIEESIVKCNVSKMELDYKFGGQKSALGTSAFDESESDGEAEKPKKQDQEAELCAELGKELGILA